MAHKSIEPRQRDVSDEELRETMEMFEEFRDKDLDNLSQWDRDMLILLTVPENKTVLGHTRDLAIAAKSAYEANATRIGDKYHGPARMLADYYDFDWKDEVTGHEEERKEKLGN